MSEKTTHGGYRPGAGAKKTTPQGAKRRALAITDAEYAEVKKLIKNLRSGKNDSDYNLL